MFVKDPMSRESKWKIKNIILLILAISCYILGVKTYYHLRENYHSVTVQLQGEATTKEQVKTLLEEEKEKYVVEEEKSGSKEIQNKVKKVPEITAYEMEEHMKITDTKLGKNKNVTKYLVYGEMNQILPVQIYRGNYVYENDYEGCILDKDTAYELFGSLDIVGQQVVIEEKIVVKNQESSSNPGEEQVTRIKQREYYIRGILDSSQPIVMIQSRSDMTQFHYLQFDYGNSSRGREYVERLLMTYSLGSSAVIVDQNLIVRLLGNVLFLPWLFAGIIIIRKTMRKFRQFIKQKEWDTITSQFLLNLIIVPILTIIGIVITAKRFAFIPLQYVPTKWSDFNSVSRTIDLIRQHVEDFNYLTPTIREVLLRENIMILLIAVAGMAVLLWIVMERIDARNMR